jgi:6-pyruvoyl-tetrahydropterin synthase
VLLLPSLGPLGQSWFVDVEWVGAPCSDGMVVDFSIAKKIAKQVIDQNFDHKAIGTPRQIVQKTELRTSVYFEYGEKREPFALSTYPEGLCLVHENTLDALAQGHTTLFEQEIAQAILKESPLHIKSIHVRLRTPTQEPPGIVFYYTHSLCQHTGNCQRFHGHRGFMEIYKEGVLDLSLTQQAAQALNGGYLAQEGYLKTADHPLVVELLKTCPSLLLYKDTLAFISYTGTQGDVMLALPKSRVLPLKQESTIENIAAFLRNQWPEIPLEVRAYEGLAKGAVCL